MTTNLLPRDLEEATWKMLAQGASDRRHPFHTPVLATVSKNGEAHLRTVVLRLADPLKKIIACHTDRRSLKILHIKSNPVVSWLFYHPELRIQICLNGIAHLIKKKSQENLNAWRRTASMGRVCYSAPMAPSTAIDEWMPNLPSNYMELANKEIHAVDDIPPDTFVYLPTTVQSTEWLELHHDGHQRIRFSYDSEGEWTHQWIAS